MFLPDFSPRPIWFSFLISVVRRGAHARRWRFSPVRMCAGSSKVGCRSTWFARSPAASRGGASVSLDRVHIERKKLDRRLARTELLEEALLFGGSLKAGRQTRVERLRGGDDDPVCITNDPIAGVHGVIADHDGASGRSWAALRRPTECDSPGE